MSLVGAHRLHISGGTFNQVAGHLNEYHVAGNLIQPHGENGINLLQRQISNDAFYNSEQRFPPPQCHPDTRIAVQQTIQSWAADEQAPRVMWLYGPAGAGKSAIAQTMAESWAANHDLAAAFFFARWRAGGGSGKCLFPTLAYQLALHIPSLRQAIGLAVEADPAICEKALEEQVHALIVDPIASLELEPSRPYLVIIDGLDECDSKSVQSRILKILFHALVENKLAFRFLICSRPEPHIRETFDSLPGNLQFLRLALDETFNPGRDILRFLRDRFSEIRRKRLPYHDASWPSERNLETLVHNASGQFIYAATVVKFVDDEYCHPVEQLRTVLSLSTTETDTSPFADLDTLYMCIFSANRNISLLMRILGAYFAIPNPDEIRTHCVRFLEEMLGLQRGSARFALRGLHSILFIPDADDHRIRVHHASLHDFLSNPARAGRFYLSNEVRHLDLARRCLAIVMDSVHHPEGYTLALLEYAHNHCHRHIPVLGRHDMIQDCLRSFREILCPAELNVLCRDAAAMTSRLMRIVDFLNSLGNITDIFPSELNCDLDNTWHILLSTLLQPTSEVLQFYEAWGVQYSQYYGSDLRISSSLGMVFQKLWGIHPDDPPSSPFWSHPTDPQSRQRLTGFLRHNPRIDIRFRAAEISLHLLACRTAETRSSIPFTLYSHASYSTRWAFASQWSTYLVQAPPTPELLAILRELIEKTIFVRREEINHPLLKEWLMAAGTQGMDIYRAFENACLVKTASGWAPRNAWLLANFSQQ